MSLKKVIACIKRNKHFLITTHTNLEGDALGSEIAFFILLKALGKQASIINLDSLPSGYSFLPGINYIKKFQKNLRYIKFDCFVILDCSDLERCGEVTKINKDNKPILNIDHHISNKRFGNINWVEPHSPSCTQMVYKLYKKLRIPLDRDIAMLLYVGILTDTGSFHYPNTTSLTHKIVSELLKYNLDIAQIYKNVFENITFKDMGLLTKILPTLRCEFYGKIVWFQIKRELLKQREASFDLSEYLLTFARAIKDVEVAVLFKEGLKQKNEVRVNLRSQGEIDVNKIAQFFGGGGHKTASGATIKGSIEEVRRRVLAKIRESFK
jgi:phosphoesterase RecJ-like protein